MIIVIDGHNKDSFRATLDEVYKLRARVFGKRLGWEVAIKDGKEIDHFDHLDPTYIVSVNEEGSVVGGLRFLQTTGPNMLSDVFFSILGGDPAPRSALLWESTRFCVDLDQLEKRRGPGSISYVTSELMIGGLEYGLQAGIEDVVTVVDPIMDRVLKRSGSAPYDYLGSEKPMGKVTALAALIDCSQDRIDAIREKAGITHDVFAGAQALSAQEAQLAARNGEADAEGVREAIIGSLQSPFLRSYFQEQFEAANSEKARKDTLDLLLAIKARAEIAV